MKKLVVFLLFCIFTPYASAWAIESTELERAVERAVLQAQNPYDQESCPAVKFKDFTFKLQEVAHGERPNKVINFYENTRKVTSNHNADYRGDRIREYELKTYANFLVWQQKNLDEHSKTANLADLFIEEGDIVDYSSVIKTKNGDSGLFCITTIEEHPSVGWNGASALNIYVIKAIRTHQTITYYGFLYVMEFYFGVEGYRSQKRMVMEDGILKMKALKKEWVDAMATMQLPKVVTNFDYINNLE